MIMNKITLDKERIKSIKHFINYEVEKHQFGNWDKFKLSSLRIHSDGCYSFRVHWICGYAGVFDDFWVQGNLFEEFPLFSVLDGLDAVQLLFHKIHIKACERLKERAEKMIEEYNSAHEYLKHIYEPGGSYNKEGKNIE